MPLRCTFVFKADYKEENVAATINNTFPHYLWLSLAYS